MAKPKLQFILEPDYDFRLFGMVSSELPAHLCNAINKILKIKMTETDPLQSENSIEEIFFQRFFYEAKALQITYQLVANRYQNFFYISELKNIDYVFKIQGNFAVSSENKLREQLRKNAAVTLITEIKPESIKKKGKLFF